MNKDVYRHFLQTYGSRPGYWAGFIAEIIRSLAFRVWTAIIMAQIAAHLAEGDIGAAKRYALYFLAVNAAGSIIGAAGDLMAHRSENGLYKRLSVYYYKKLTGKDMTFYRDHQTGYLVSLFKQYTDSMMLVGRFFRTEAIRTVISLGAPGVVLFTMNWQLGLVTIGIIAVQAGYVMWSSSKANTYRHLSHELYRKVMGEVSDEITNITAFKSSGAEKQAHDKVTQLSTQEARAFWLRRKAAILLDLPRDLLTTVGVAVALFVVLSDASSSAESIGLIVLTLTYMFQIIRSVGMLPDLITQHDELITKAYPTLAYLSKEYENVRDPLKPKRLTVNQGTVEIENMSFAYPSLSHGRTVPVFKNLSLTIKGGEQVGIVGLSGAGKSTLASLLLRFDDVGEGSIKIDGVDIRQARQDDLRHHIAYVPQEPLLFHRTIRENIAYFNGTATNKDVVRAAKAAHAHEFIAKLPDGYDSMVGERGVKLSGGQKQRVVIARAILKNAPIMIFDEATSALDTESEQIIQKALPKIIGKHTAIVIAHRLSTIVRLDRILVMHEGRIIEEGTHKELLALQGRYYSLWQKQAAYGHDADQG